MQSLSFRPPFRNQPITVHHTPADRPQFSGGLPAMAAAGLGDQFTTLLAQNQVLSRVFVEFFGYTGWNVALARNGWERFERAMDSVCWAVLGMGVPVLLGKMLVPRFNRNLKAEFPKAFLPRHALGKGRESSPWIYPLNGSTMPALLSGLPREQRSASSCLSTGCVTCPRPWPPRCLTVSSLPS
ncbi:MAG: hypothetical protein R2857_13320 [Vampirovibrionales bacterium]